MESQDEGLAWQVPILLVVPVTSNNVLLSVHVEAILVSVVLQREVEYNITSTTY